MLQTTYVEINMHKESMLEENSTRISLRSEATYPHIHAVRSFQFCGALGGYVGKWPGLGGKSPTDSGEEPKISDYGCLNAQ